MGAPAGVIGYTSPDALGHCKFTITLTLISYRDRKRKNLFLLGTRNVIIMYIKEESQEILKTKTSLMIIKQRKNKQTVPVK